MKKVLFLLERLVEYCKEMYNLYNTTESADLRQRKPNLYELVVAGGACQGLLHLLNVCLKAKGMKEWLFRDTVS